jgi:hypothetical protein
MARRLPEVVTRYAKAPFPITFYDALNEGKSEPVTHEVPAGSVAVVSLHAWFISLYDTSATGLNVSEAVRFLPVLTDLSGGSARSIEVSNTGDPLRFMSKSRPTIVVVQPAATRLSWRASIDDALLISSDYPDARVFLWLRAVVVDAGIPHEELLRLLGTGLS